MKTASAADANRHFSKLLREVAAGETVTITSRGKPVARLSPIETDDLLEKEAAKRALIEELLARPVLNRGPFPRHEAYEDAQS